MKYKIIRGHHQYVTILEVKSSFYKELDYNKVLLKSDYNGKGYKITIPKEIFIKYEFYYKMIEELLL